MLSYIPNKSLSGQKIFKEVDGDFIKLWTKPKKGGVSRDLMLPKKINFGKDFWMGIGLFIADGTKPGKKNKEKGRIAFTNGDPEQIKTVLGVFDHFGIDRGLWKGIISANSYYVQDEKRFSSQAAQYWSKQTGLSEEKISTYFYNRKPKRHRETLEYGTIQIRLSNIILNSVLWELINNN